MLRPMLAETERKVTWSEIDSGSGRRSVALDVSWCNCVFQRSCGDRRSILAWCEEVMVLWLRISVWTESSLGKPDGSELIEVL